MKSINSVLASFSGGAIVAIPRAYLDLLNGDYTTAALLSQLVYWSDKCKSEDGWIYKTHEEMESEIGLSQYKITRATDVLVNLGVLERQVKKIGSAPVSHYRVKFSELLNRLFERGEDEICEYSQNLPPPPPPPTQDEGGERRLTAEAYKERVAGAMQRNAERNSRLRGQINKQGIENYILKVPEYMRDLAHVFCDKFGRPPTKKEDSYWRSNWSVQYEIGLTPEDIGDAFEEMYKRGLTIKSPQSLNAIAEELKRERESQPNKVANRQVIVSEGAKKWVNEDDPEGKKQGKQS